MRYHTSNHTLVFLPFALACLMRFVLQCSLYSSLTMTRLVCPPMARLFGVFVYLDAYVSCYELKLQQNFEFDIYSTSNSSTSQKITCKNSLCDNQNACTAETSSCPYIVQYLSANTSTSGVLVEDVPYLMTEDETPRIVEAPIVFGYVAFNYYNHLRLEW